MQETNNGERVMDIYGRFDIHLSFRGTHATAEKVWTAVSNAVDGFCQPGDQMIVDPSFGEVHLQIDLDDAECWPPRTVELPVKEG